MYVCVYVCMYVYMYVCITLGLKSLSYEALKYVCIYVLYVWGTVPLT